MKKRLITLMAFVLSVLILTASSAALAQTNGGGATATKTTNG